jgi:predicted dehydrogenase
MTPSAALERPVRLGIIGCGYVTAMSHLPAATLTPDVQIAALVDVRVALAQELAHTHNIPFVTQDYTELYDKVDGVIIATPHHLHTAAALQFLKQGIAVLVEKPMAVTVDDCQQLIAAAARTQAKLAVGLVRRFYDSTRLVKHLLTTRFLGDVISFSAEEAVLFDGFNASAFTIMPPAGGVLLDTGPHVLDTLHWWLGDFAQVRYWDDAIQGVEANSKLEVVTSSGVTGTVELSRTRALGNAIHLHCSEGDIHLSTRSVSEVTIESPRFSGPVVAQRPPEPGEIAPILYAFARQLSNFARAIRLDEPLVVCGQEGLRSVATSERCKASKMPLAKPNWAQLNPKIIQQVGA